MSRVGTDGDVNEVDRDMIRSWWWVLRVAAKGHPTQLVINLNKPHITHMEHVVVPRHIGWHIIPRARNNPIDGTLAYNNDGTSDDSSPASAVRCPGGGGRHVVTQAAYFRAAGTCGRAARARPSGWWTHISGEIHITERSRSGRLGGDGRQRNHGDVWASTKFCAL